MSCWAESTAHRHPDSFLHSVSRKKKKAEMSTCVFRSRRGYFECACTKFPSQTVHDVSCRASAGYAAPNHADIAVVQKEAFSSSRHRRDAALGIAQKEQRISPPCQLPSPTVQLCNASRIRCLCTAWAFSEIRPAFCPECGSSVPMPPRCVEGYFEI